MYYLLFQHTTETPMESDFIHFVNVKADVQENVCFSKSWIGGDIATVTEGS